MKYKLIFDGYISGDMIITGEKKLLAYLKKIRKEHDHRQDLISGRHDTIHKKLKVQIQKIAA